MGYRNMANLDIYDFYMMSDQYRKEEEWSREQTQIERDEYNEWKRKKDRYEKLKKINNIKMGTGKLRRTYNIDDEDIPF